MKNHMQLFSKKFSKEDFDKAMELKNSLIENEGVPKEDLDKVKVDSKNIF